MKITQLMTLLIFSANVNYLYASSYLGAASGNSSVDFNGYDDSSSFKIFGGTKKNNFGYEIAYINQGAFKVSGASFAQVDVNIVEVSMLGYLPLADRFDIFAKLGFSTWFVTGEVEGRYLGGDSGSTFNYGFGANFSIVKNFSLRAEYQIFNDVSGASTNSTFFGAAITF